MSPKCSGVMNVAHLSNYGKDCDQVVAYRVPIYRVALDRSCIGQLLTFDSYLTVINDSS